MNSAAFGMLTPPPLAPRPRSTSMMLMSEVGIPLQVAVVQRKVPEYFRAVLDLGFTGVEMIEAVIQPIAAGQR